MHVSDMDCCDGPQGQNDPGNSELTIQNKEAWQSGIHQMVHVNCKKQGPAASGQSCTLAGTP